MKLRLLDILACPQDKNWPLKAHIFEKKQIENPIIPEKDKNTNVVCRFYCAKKGIKLIEEINQGEYEISKKVNKINYSADCKECLSVEIVNGVIECRKCGNYYPIAEEIPMMLEPELRNTDVENEFINKWSGKIKELSQKKR